MSYHVTPSHRKSTLAFLCKHPFYKQSIHKTQTGSRLQREEKKAFDQYKCDWNGYCYKIAHICYFAESGYLQENIDRKDILPKDRGTFQSRKQSHETNMRTILQQYQDAFVQFCHACAAKSATRNVSKVVPPTQLAMYPHPHPHPHPQSGLGGYRPPYPRPYPMPSAGQQMISHDYHSSPFRQHLPQQMSPTPVRSTAPAPPNHFQTTAASANIAHVSGVKRSAPSEHSVAKAPSVALSKVKRSANGPPATKRFKSNENETPKIAVTTARAYLAAAEEAKTRPVSRFSRSTPQLLSAEGNEVQSINVNNLSTYLRDCLNKVGEYHSLLKDEQKQHARDDEHYNEDDMNRMTQLTADIEMLQGVLMTNKSSTLEANDSARLRTIYKRMQNVDSKLPKLRKEKLPKGFRNFCSLYQNNTQNVSWQRKSKEKSQSDKAKERVKEIANLLLSVKAKQSVSHNMLDVVNFSTLGIVSPVFPSGEGNLHFDREIFDIQNDVLKDDLDFLRLSGIEYEISRQNAAQSTTDGTAITIAFSSESVLPLCAKQICPTVDITPPPLLQLTINESLYGTLIEADYLKLGITTSAVTKIEFLLARELTPQFVLTGKRNRKMRWNEKHVKWLMDRIKTVEFTPAKETFNVIEIFNCYADGITVLVQNMLKNQPKKV